MEEELSGSIKFEVPEEESKKEVQATKLGKSKAIRILLIGFSALFFITIGIFGTIFYTNNRKAQPQSPSTEFLTPSNTPLSPTMPLSALLLFKNAQNTFSFMYEPPTQIVEENGVVWIDDIISLAESAVALTECRGACPVIEERTTKKLGEYTWTVTRGFVGGIGGTTPQAQQYYELPNGSTIILVTVNELDRDQPLMIARDQGIVPQDRIDTIENILKTFQFIEGNTDAVWAGASSYMSKALGIQFRYPREFNSEMIQVIELGSKIFVYPESMGQEGAQSVEVFEKPATQNIKDAITERFLSGKDPQKCFVTTEGYDQNTVGDKTTSKYFITFPQNGNEGIDELFGNTQYCSPNYAETNGMRYFWYDSLHPTRYLFFSIGQYAIMAGEDTAWQDTVEITQ